MFSFPNPESSDFKALPGQKRGFSAGSNSSGQTGNKETQTGNKEGHGESQKEDGETAEAYQQHSSPEKSQEDPQA